MSKAILGFGVSVTRLAALAGSKLASTPSNDDIVKYIYFPKNEENVKNFDNFNLNFSVYLSYFRDLGIVREDTKFKSKNSNFLLKGEKFFVT